jgi:hypothetical protein
VFLWQWLRNDTFIVTSHDYTQACNVGFSAQHLPISVDFTEIPQPNIPDDGVIRIVHTPTAPIRKNTDDFLQAVKKLSEKHKQLKIEPVLIEGKPWQECLQLKAQCNIMYDQMQIGSYGMGVIESWALRQPVVGRASPWLRSWYPNLPIVDAVPETLMEHLEGLVLHGDVRQEIGEKGMLFCQEHHDLTINIRKLGFLINHVQER